MRLFGLHCEREPSWWANKKESMVLHLFFSFLFFLFFLFFFFSTHFAFSIIFWINLLTASSKHGVPEKAFLDFLLLSSRDQR